MVTVVGNNIAISIGGTDYTSKIVEFSESGGNKILRNIKTYGNNYKSIVVGREDYNVTVKFKFDSALETTFFGDDDNDTVSIVITTGVETITYNNMVNTTYGYELKGDDAGYINITFIAPARTDGDYNRSVIAV